MSEQSPSAKVIFSLIVGIPVLVIGLSSLLYYMANRDVVELDTVNNGTLIQPPVAVADLSPRDRDGEPLPFDRPQSQWQFAVVGGASCRGACERMLYLTRQTHTALGKKMGRVGRLYLNLDERYSAELEQLLADEYDQLRPAFASAEAYRTLSERLALEPGEAGFYVIDPKGWVMMYYRVPDTSLETLTGTGKLVIKDMKRLLR